MRIAVVVRPAIPLPTAWSLDRAGHQVVLIERLPELGLAAHGMPLMIDGASLTVDMPSRMFNAAL